MPINFDLKKYINPVFIETGTYRGDGVKKALQYTNNIYVDIPLIYYDKGHGDGQLYI